MNFFKRKRLVVLLGVIAVTAVVLTVLNGVVMANPRTATDPVGEITYQIQISGIADVELDVVEMPVARVEPVEFIDGQDIILHKHPGLVSCSNLVLSGNPNSPTLNDVWGWYEEIKNDSYDKRSVTIDMIDSDGQIVTRYHCMDAWPIEWKVVKTEGQGNTSSASVEIVFVVEQLFRQPYD